MEKLRKIAEESPVILGFLVAILGGAVGGINNVHIENITVRTVLSALWHLFCRLMSAAFVGVVVGLIIQATDCNRRLGAAIIGMCGYASVDLLRWLPSVLIKKAEDLFEKL